MLTQEQNELLTRVGAGTPMGELLRRYWHPVALARDLTGGNPVKFVRILGEDLVLFRDKKDRVGLIGDRCCHRGASLSYGRVEERGIEASQIGESPSGVEPPVGRTLDVHGCGEVVVVEDRPLVLGKSEELFRIGIARSRDRQGWFAWVWAGR